MNIYKRIYEVLVNEDGSVVSRKTPSIPTRPKGGNARLWRYFTQKFGKIAPEKLVTSRHMNPVRTAFGGPNPGRTGSVERPSTAGTTGRRIS